MTTPTVGAITQDGWFDRCFTLVCQDVGIDLVSVDLARCVKQDAERRAQALAGANRYSDEHVFDVARRHRVERRGSVGRAAIPVVPHAPTASTEQAPGPGRSCSHAMRSAAR